MNSGQTKSKAKNDKREVILTAAWGLIRHYGYNKTTIDDIAKAAAKRLSAALETKVVVTAGIHWDNLSTEGISKVNSNSDILITTVLRKIQSERRKGT